MYETIKSYYAQASRWAFPVLIVLLLVSLFTCNRERSERTTLEQRLDASEAHTVQLENENGQMVAENKTILTDNARELKDLTDSVFNLKKREAKLIGSVSTYARIVQNAKFSGKTAPFIDKPRTDPNDTTKTVYLPQPADTNLMRVPRSFVYPGNDQQDTTIKFSGTVTRRGVTVDSLEIPNTLHFRIAQQKTGFLKLGRTSVVQAVNSNPAIQNTGIASIIVKQKASFWIRVVRPVLAAAVTGFVVYKVHSQ